MFGATNVVKYSGKSKRVYGGHWITFDGLGSWNFGNNLLIIFGADNSLWFHTNNQKNNFLGDTPTNNIDDSIDTAEKKFSINFGKAKQNFA